MTDLLQIAGSLGVGALLGTLIFIMYRIDRKASEKRLSSIIEQDRKSREKHAKALAKLTTLITRLNGRLK